MNDQMFFHYEHREMGDTAVACKVTPTNIDWLAMVTGAKRVQLRATSTRPMLVEALDFKNGNVAEVGDYVINRGNSYSPIEGIIFEQDYEG